MSEDFGFNPCNEPGYYFVSYNSEDAERVGAIARRLHSNNVPLWYDKGIPYGEKWEAIIAEKIQKSQAVILFFTKGILFKEDSYVKKEYRIATKNFKKKVYVVMLDYIDDQSVPLDKVFWFNDIRDNHNIDIVDINDPDIISNKIMSAINIKNRRKKQSQAIENKEESNNPFLALVRESTNTPMNNGDIFGGEPVSVGSFLGNPSDNIFLKKIAAEKEKQEYTKTNKPDFPPIVPPASPSAPAVADKLQPKNDSNNMSSENKSDGLDDDQFYIMINEIINGKEATKDKLSYAPTIPEIPERASISQSSEDDRFFEIINDIIIRNDPKETQATSLKSCADKLKPHIEKMISSGKTVAISPVGCAKPLLSAISTVDGCEEAFFADTALCDRLDGETTEIYVAQCAKISKENSGTDLGICISPIYNEKNGSGDFVIVCVADSQRAKAVKVYANPGENKKHLIVVAIIKLCEMMEDFSVTEQTDRKLSVASKLNFLIKKSIYNINKNTNH